MGSGLGGMVATGMALGAGSAMGHMAVRSLTGGGGHGGEAQGEGQQQQQMAPQEQQQYAEPQQ